jgi:hypothetical protein
MKILLNIVLGICCILLFHSIFMLYRNKKVFNYKMKLLDKVSSLAQKDSLADREWKWRYEVFTSVSYNEMLYKFWKPLDSFYKDKSFIIDSESN